GIQTGARGFYIGIQRRKPSFTKFALDEADLIQPLCTSFTFMTPLRISLLFHAVIFRLNSPRTLSFLPAWFQRADHPEYLVAATLFDHLTELERTIVNQSF